jgi:hypothetical protein
MTRFATFEALTATELRRELLCFSSSRVILKFHLHAFFTHRNSIKAILSKNILSHSLAGILAFLEVNECIAVFVIVAPLDNYRG